MVAEYRHRSLKQYSKNLFGILFIGSGAFLLIEHIYFWGDFAFFDFVGHEWLGITLVLLGCILNINLKVPLSPELKRWFGKK